jgi:hypothetical protein
MNPFLRPPGEVVLYFSPDGTLAGQHRKPRPHRMTYLLGRDRVRVHDGSWAEWGRMPEAPVEQA